MCDKKDHKNICHSCVPQPDSASGDVLLVEDGPMDQFAAFDGVKVIHVLKEPTMDTGLTNAAWEVINNAENRGCPGCVSSGNRSDLWTTVCRRSLALQSLSAASGRNWRTFEDLEHSKCDYAKALRRSALFNLNDTIPHMPLNTKRPYSHWNTLRRMGVLRWLQQGPRLIDLLADSARPSRCSAILICGGMRKDRKDTFHLLLDLLRGNQMSRNIRLDALSDDIAVISVVTGAANTLRIPIIRARHPSLRGSPEKEYYEFRDRCTHAFNKHLNMWP